MIKAKLLAGLVVVSLGLAATAQADITWHWTLTGEDTGSGTFTTVAYSSSANPTYFPGTAGYLLTGVTGVFDGFTITGLTSLADAASGSYGVRIKFCWLEGWWMFRG